MSFIRCRFNLKAASHFSRELVNDKSLVAKKWHRFLFIHLFLIYFVTESINFGLVLKILCFWLNELWYFYKNNYCRFIFTYSEYKKRKREQTTWKNLVSLFIELFNTTLLFVTLKISCDIINTSKYYIYPWSGLKRYDSFHIRF